MPSLLAITRWVLISFVFESICLAQLVPYSFDGCVAPTADNVLTDSLALTESFVITFTYNAPLNRTLVDQVAFVATNEDGDIWLAMQIINGGGAQLGFVSVIDHGVTTGVTLCIIDDTSYLDDTFAVSIFASPSELQVVFEDSNNGESVCWANRVGQAESDLTLQMSGPFSADPSAELAENITICDFEINNFPTDQFEYQGQVCFNAADTHDNATFTSTFEGEIEGVRLVHTSGCATCASQVFECVSQWGCDTDGTSIDQLYVLVADEDGAQVFPSVGDVDLSQSTSFTLDGFNAKSAFLDLTASDSITVAAGDQFTIYYSEFFQYDVFGRPGLTDDNSGTVCAGVYFIKPIDSNTLCRADDASDFVFYEDCCTGGNCAANQGPCTSDLQCSDGLGDELVCGTDNCNIDFGFGSEHDCCVALCAQPDSPFDENCCTPVRQCPENIGGCSSDDHCHGDLTCGDNNCDAVDDDGNRLVPDDDANCCIRLCANSGHPDWTFAEHYDEDCCTEERPCPRNEGGCTGDDSCFGDLVCALDACGPGFEAGSSCCVDPCSAPLGDIDWAYNSTCCTEERPCPAYHGGCTDDDQCLGDLACGTNNCDETRDANGIFPSEANCCVGSCAAFDPATFEFDGWQFDVECCSESSPCPMNQGHCESDNECLGGLVCGAEGGNSCDVNFPDLAGGARPRCCVDPCADPARNGATHEDECCTDENPCPASAGNCTEDSTCFGDLVCGQDRNTCPLYINYEDDARCCSRCPYGVDGPLEVTQYPRLDEENTHLAFDGDVTIFQLRIVIPYQWHFSRFSFQGAVVNTAAFESNATASSPYWTAEEGPCETVYIGRIPWDDFRSSWGGVEENEILDENAEASRLSFRTTIEIENERYNYLFEGGDSVLRIPSGNTLLVPFEVLFDLIHPVGASFNVTGQEVDVPAVITDLSVVSVNPRANDDDADADRATAQLIFLTSVPAPFRLVPLNVTTPGVDRFGNSTSLTINQDGSIDGPDGPTGLFLHSDAQCTADGDNCRQEWRIEMTAGQCTLNGLFDAFLQIVCFEGENCNPRPPQEDVVLIEMTTSSDNFCGETQLVEVSGDIIIRSNPTECNGRLNATVRCFPGETAAFPETFALEEVTVLTVRAIPHVEDDLPGDAQVSGDSNALLVYNNEEAIAPFDFQVTAMDNNSVTFNFIWHADYLRCDISTAIIEVVVQVGYLATRDLGLLGVQTERMLLTFDGTSGSEQALIRSRKLMQNGGADQRERAVFLASSANILADGASAGADASASGDGNELPVWVIAIIAVLVTGLCCLIVIVVAVFLYFKNKKENGGAAATSSGRRRPSRRASNYVEQPEDADGDDSGAAAEEIEVQPVTSSGGGSAAATVTAAA